MHNTGYYKELSIRLKHLGSLTSRIQLMEYIEKLDLPDGLKEILRRHGLVSEDLSKMSGDEISAFLNIDGDIGRMVKNAVREYIKNENEREAIVSSTGK
jgi:hypothetical protein